MAHGEVQGPLAPSPAELLPQCLRVAGPSCCPEQSPRTIWTSGSTGTLGLATVSTMAVLSGIQKWQEASKGFH